MDSNLEIIKKEFTELKGQFVITASWKIERLIGIGMDDLDYYYITYNGRKTTWNTCVGRLMPLKGFLRDEDYNELVRLAKLNHYDQLFMEGGKSENEEAFRTHMEELCMLNGSDVILFGLYMELKS